MRTASFFQRVRLEQPAHYLGALGVAVVGLLHHQHVEVEFGHAGWKDRRGTAARR